MDHGYGEWLGQYGSELAFSQSWGARCRNRSVRSGSTSGKQSTDRAITINVTAAQIILVRTRRNKRNRDSRFSHSSLPACAVTEMINSVFGRILLPRSPTIWIRILPTNFSFFFDLIVTFRR